MLIGHHKILSFFEHAIEHQSLSHSYCLVGQEQVGKRTLARLVAATLLKTSIDRLDTHPDFFYVERALDEKTGKRKKELTVEQARQLRARLQTTSWMQGYRVVLINEVETMNEEASNALLKLLEEPGDNIVFFLLTANDSLLLPTIRSRTQVVQMGLVSEGEIKQGLLDRGIFADQINEIVPLSWGRPGRALTLLENSEARESNKRYIQKLEQIVSDSIYERFKIVEELCGGKKEGSMSREEFDRILEVWIMWWRERLVHPSEIPHHSNQDKNILDHLSTARQMLWRNVNPRLLLENVVIEM